MDTHSKPFIFKLTDAEIEDIVQPLHPGDQQVLYELLRDQLADGMKTVRLDDAQLGMLIRLTTQSVDSNFQLRLHRAFLQSLYQLVDLPSPPIHKE